MVSKQRGAEALPRVLRPSICPGPGRHPIIGLPVFSIKPSGDTTLTKRVAAASDDAEEEGPTGTTPNRMWLDSSDIELVSDLDSPSAGVQKVGLRFTGMNIPVGATITDAYLVFRAVSADSPNVEQ